jgi:hypothetical protein
VEVVLGMVRACRNEAFSYFARFASLSEVLRACTDDPAPSELHSAEIHSPSPLRRAKVAIAAAFLLRDRVAFDSLVRGKPAVLREFIGDDQPELRDRFQRLARELEASWPV